MLAIIITNLLFIYDFAGKLFVIREPFSDFLKGKLFKAHFIRRQISFSGPKRAISELVTIL